MNQLKVNLQQTIVTLHKEQGWSKRKIARELGVDRITVRRYLGLADARGDAVDEGSKSPTIPRTGSQEHDAPKSPTLDPNPRTGDNPAADSKSPTPASNPRTGSGPGPESLCEPWRERILEALKSGLTLQRIYQDLVAEEQFSGSYDSVWRFAQRLQSACELPFRRMECDPGHELQVDFGLGAFVIEDGQRRRPHLFRAVLSRSRKGYSEVVWRQTTENFIRCLENAFRYFGGVTRTVVIDNLRAAVSHVDWYDPEVNPKVEEFCRHYGTIILPTKPAMPRHKGKVEAQVKYTQNNAVAGRKFESLGAQNLFLLDWEANVADKRVHGTTKAQVGRVFTEIEKPALLPLPASLFPCFEEAQRTVHRDGYIELQKSYYSVPPEYLGRKVWVRWEARLVRIFNHRMEQIALHTRAEPGKFTTDPAHIHDHKRVLIERGADWLLDRARLIGKYSGTWAEQMFKQRGHEGIRSLHGLIALAERHSADQLEKVCHQAIELGAWRLREVRQLLDQTPSQQLTFLDKHPLIRDLEAYDKLVPVCFTPNTSKTEII